MSGSSSVSRHSSHSVHSSSSSREEEEVKQKKTDGDTGQGDWSLEEVQVHDDSSSSTDGSSSSAEPTGSKPARKFVGDSEKSQIKRAKDANKELALQRQQQQGPESNCLQDVLRATMLSDDPRIRLASAAVSTVLAGGGVAGVIAVAHVTVFPALGTPAIYAGVSLAIAGVVALGCCSCEVARRLHG